MKIKHHPQVFVELFVDGRYEIHAPKTVNTRREALSVAALKMGIPVMIREADGKIEPGRYEAILSGLKLLKQTFDIELKPVK